MSDPLLALDPENVSMIGFAVLLIGFILTLGGMLFLGQVYSCGLSIGTSCPSDVTARFEWAFPLMIFGGYMILLGGLATVAGYMVKAILSSKDTRPVHTV
ncbi:MAG: hypothetical protein AUF79_09070 [Crenarchaeota archaeon 13_1_20CM_2_51_8]|nr:MAG: hypothetical protein AUF79_09070 [Crenarchaeota archaeon 13_1_20CM_2_51_8]